MWILGIKGLIQILYFFRYVKSFCENPFGNLNNNIIIVILIFIIKFIISIIVISIITVIVFGLLLKLRCMNNLFITYLGKSPQQH